MRVESRCLRSHGAYRPWAASALGGALWLAAPAAADGLQPPRVVKAGDQAISVEIGHAAPCVADMDGDGLADLLVGQFGDGKLLVFRNTGSAKAPVFAKATEFVADGKPGTIPSG